MVEQSFITAFFSLSDQLFSAETPIGVPGMYLWNLKTNKQNKPKPHEYFCAS